MAMNLRLDPELDAALTALASAEGTSKHEVIRQAVIDRLRQSEHRAAVAESAERMAARWGDVIERLGNA
jgi:hypothetical protein